MKDVNYIKLIMCDEFDLKSAQHKKRVHTFLKIDVQPNRVFSFVYRHLNHLVNQNHII